MHRGLQGMLAKEIIGRSVPFVDIQDFTPLLEKIKDKKIVMLGESTHGTKEFYEWRSLITRELIQKHGFKFIAVEGDWPPCEFINRFIRGESSGGAFEALSHFSRWPTWMWGNAEVVNLMDWLRGHNDERDEGLVGLHGLDIYSFFESMDMVVDTLSTLDVRLSRKVRELYSCFEPFWGNERRYARSLVHQQESCESTVIKVLKLIQAAKDPEDYRWFNAEQNAFVVIAAEKYYRSMASGDEEIWNIRDHHMLNTLKALTDLYGSESKCIVWEHNSHIGDYKATDMKVKGQVNLGGLARNNWGKENVALIGFTTYRGKVTASPTWEGPARAMDLPPGKPGSIESLLHQAVPQVGNKDFYLLFDDVEMFSPLNDFRGHRAIGVVYHPGHESKHNYVPSALGDRYDALVFFDKTTALTPLKLKVDRMKLPDTWPFGAQI